jgi:hypothetical protein
MDQLGRLPLRVFSIDKNAFQKKSCIRRRLGTAAQKACTCARYRFAPALECTFLHRRSRHSLQRKRSMQRKQKVGLGRDVVNPATRWFLTQLIVGLASQWRADANTLESVRQGSNKTMRCHCALFVRPTEHAQSYKLRYVSWATIESCH